MSSEASPQPEAVAAPPSSEETVAESQVAESHRAFVREIDGRFGRVYGTGGALVIATIGGLLGLGWWLGMLGSAGLWMFTFTMALIALFVVRRFANARRAHLIEVVQEYCQANGFSVEELHAYYVDQQLFPFFTALFEAPRVSRVERP